MDLVRVRSLLVAELGKQTRRRLLLNQRLFYEQGNKSGHFLAHAVKTARAPNQIHQLRDRDDKILLRNDDIAHHFETYYRELYYTTSALAGPMFPLRWNALTR